MCPAGGSNRHRMHWPVNSSDRLLITMRNSYQLGDGCHPVLLTRDGSRCFQITPYERMVLYEAGDFWFGNPHDVVHTHSSKKYRGSTSQLNIRQKDSDLIVRFFENEAYTLTLLRPNGQVMYRLNRSGSDEAAIPVSGLRGLYILKAESKNTSITQRATLY